MILKVTKRDLKNAFYGDAFDCPIARALKRKFPKEYILVGGFDVDLGNKTYKFANGGPSSFFVNDCIRESRPFSVEILGLTEPGK